MAALSLLLLVEHDLTIGTKVRMLSKAADVSSDRRLVVMHHAGSMLLMLLHACWSCLNQVHFKFDSYTAAAGLQVMMRLISGDAYVTAQL